MKISSTIFCEHTDSPNPDAPLHIPGHWVRHNSHTLARLEDKIQLRCVLGCACTERILYRTYVWGMVVRAPATDQNDACGITRLSNGRQQSPNIPAGAPRLQGLDSFVVHRCGDPKESPVFVGWLPHEVCCEDFPEIPPIANADLGHDDVARGHPPMRWKTVGVKFLWVRHRSRAH